MKRFTESRLSRREALVLGLAAGICATGTPVPGAQQQGLIEHTVPATGERLPVIGVGSNSFTEGRRSDLRALLQRMVELGGSVIDTAPVYGDSELVIGELLAELQIRDRIFLASKLTA